MELVKEKLRALIKAGRAKEESDLVPYANDSRPDEPGNWTAKDQLAHLTGWRRIAADEMEAVRTGGPPPNASNDLDVENTKIYERTHRQAAMLIREAARMSWDQLVAAMEGCSEEDWAKPRIRQPAQPLWRVISNNAYFHLTEHLGYWHSDQGNATAAEAAARWGHDLLSSTFPDDYGRGVAAYDLGCFYAKHGRAEEAIPYLRKGIELRPALREWARHDTDLDPIRSTPDLVSLLT